MPYRQELRSSFWLGLTQATRILSGFVVGVIVVRYLGAEQYGALMLALAISGFFSAFGNLGLPRVLLKELAVPQAEGRPLVASAFVLQVAGGTIGVAGTVAVAFALGHSGGIALMAGLFAAALLLTGGTLLQQVFLAVHRLKASAGANILAMASALGYRLMLVAAAAPLVWFALATLLQNLVFLLASLVWGRPVLRQLAGRFRPDRRTMALLFGGAAPLFVASLLQSIPLYSDRVVIGQYLSLADVGLYAVLIQLISIPQMLIASFVGGASPRLIRSFAEAGAAGEPAEEVRFVLGVATAAGAVMFAGMVVAAPILVPLIYGPGFEVDPAIVALMCLGLLVNIPNTLRAEFLLVNRRQNLAIAIGLFHAIGTVALQVALIPLFGLMGAALAYAMQMTFFAAIMNHAFPALAPYRRLYWRALGFGLTLRPLLSYAGRLLADRRTGGGEAP